MRFRLLIVLAAGAVFRLSASRAGELTVATLNVENLFDDLDDPYRWDEGTPAKPEKSLQLLTAFIRKLDADVLALQEVESREVLEQFNRARLDSLYAHVVCLEGNDGRGIDCALLSKVPVLSATSYQHRRWPPVRNIPWATGFARDVLRVRLKPTEQSTLDLLVLHLKSKGGGESSDVWRTREAQEVRAIVKEVAAESGGAPLAVLGDFNDLPNAPPLTALFDPNATPRLVDLTRAVALPERWSYIYKGNRQQLDYVIANEALQKALVADTIRFLRPAEEATDHSAIAAAFDLPGTVRRDVPALPPWLALAHHPKPDLDKAIPASDTETVRKRMAQWTVIRGAVGQVFWSPTGKVCYLNFRGVPKAGVSGVIFQRDFDRFPELRTLNGKTIVIRGVVGEYEGNLQIVLNDPGQLVVAEGQ